MVTAREVVARAIADLHGESPMAHTSDAEHVLAALRKHWLSSEQTDRIYESIERAGHLTTVTGVITRLFNEIYP